MARLGCLQHRPVPRPLSAGGRRSRSRPTGAAGRRSSRSPTSFADHPGADRQRRWTPHRPPAAVLGPRSWSGHAPTEVEEAGWIANLVLDLDRRGRSLPRHRGPGPGPRRIPAPGGAVRHIRHPGPARRPHRACSTSPRRVVLGQTFAWLADIEWRRPLRPRTVDHREGAVRRVPAGLQLPDRRRGTGWHGSCASGRRPCQGLTAQPTSSASSTSCSTSSSVRSWDLSDPLAVNRLGTLARFSSLLADYESVRRRARPDPDAPGEQVGGQDRGHLVLPQPGHPHHQLRPGRLRGIRRRGRLRAQRGRPHHGPPGQGPGVAGRLRPIA